MLLAVAGGFGGALFLFGTTGLLIGVPIVGTLRKNRRVAAVRAEIDRTAHMEGWVPGSTLAVTARRFAGVDTASETAGPRIVATAPGPPGTWVTVVNGRAPERPDFSRWQPAGDPLAVLAEEAAGPAGTDEGSGSNSIGRTSFNLVAGRVESAVSSISIAGGFRPPARPCVAVGRGEALVFGHPQLAGCVAEPDRAKVVELGCYLALHSTRKMKRAEVIEALWPSEDGDKTTGTLRNMMWMLRQSWGEALVPSATHGMYGLSEEVSTDWERFRDLVAGSSGEEEIEVLTRALTLLRGMPFEGVPDGAYAWADTEMFTASMENAGRQAAHRLARLTLACGELDHARWAAEKGLVVSPYDRELWSVLVEIAAQRGPAEVERTYERARGVLGEEVGGLIEVAGDPREDGSRK